MAADECDGEAAGFVHADDARVGVLVGALGGQQRREQADGGARGEEADELLALGVGGGDGFADRPPVQAAVVGPEGLGELRGGLTACGGGGDQADHV